MTACKDFKPFPYAPEVCDNCGKLADTHPRPAEPDNLTKAMWKVLLAEGGVWSYYGGHFEVAARQGPYANAMAQIADHMATCKIDWKKTDRPSMDHTLLEFAGTEDESIRITGKVAGKLYCVCGKMGSYPWYDEIGFDGLTLGELIWKVVHADD